MEKIEQEIISLVSSYKENCREIFIDSFKRAGNNKTFIIVCGSEKYFVKHFFHDINDKRDRFSTELNFIRYAEKFATGYVPEIYQVNKETRLILYEYITGTSFSSVPAIKEEHVLQAISFFQKLNAHQNSEEAKDIRNASEACFSIAQHIDLLDKRVSQFSRLKELQPVDVKARQVFEEIRHKWDFVKNNIIQLAKNLALDIDADLDYSQRVLSPSDFGFHNAMIKPDGNIMFFDFEYAGWDDPAKTVGDFFGQIQMPVPTSFYRMFCDAVTKDMDGKNDMLNRIDILSPLFKIKWACIALNIFLPVHLARRRFSNPELDETILKEEQLVKAIKILNE